MQNTKEIKFPVVEIFDSIDGEGITAGHLATFIRLAGCNIRCGYCDTSYALNKSDGTEMTVDEIVARVKEVGNKRVTLTGGEPLWHEGVKTLIEAITGEGHRVNIETNGTIDIKPYTLLYGTIITMDYKTLSSGMNGKMNLANIRRLRNFDVLKIVCRESDFQNIEAMLKLYRPWGKVFLSPIYGEVEPVRLVEFAKHLRDEGIYNVRVQIQLHKIIWNPEQKGV